VVIPYACDNPGYPGLKLSENVGIMPNHDSAPQTAIRKKSPFLIWGNFGSPPLNLGTLGEYGQKWPNSCQISQISCLGLGLLAVMFKIICKVRILSVDIIE
jgi:hypothetical protein